MKRFGIRYTQWIALTTALLLGVQTFAVAAQEQAASASPATVVERFQNELIAVMKAAGQLGYHGRYERLAPAVERSHDMATIARISVGSYWDGLDPAQRRQLTDTFTRLSIATYAARFDGYSGERFEIQSSGDLSTEVAGVRSVLAQADGGEVSFDYLLNRQDRGWHIVNIVADGVSDLALKRAEYVQILRRDGFDALIAMLEEKIAASAE